MEGTFFSACEEPRSDTETSTYLRVEFLMHIRVVLLEPFSAFPCGAAELAVLSMRHAPSAWRFLADDSAG